MSCYVFQYTAQSLLQKTYPCNRQPPLDNFPFNDVWKNRRPSEPPTNQPRNQQPPITQNHQQDVA